MSISPIFGRPGPQVVSRMVHKYVMQSGGCTFLPGGGEIDTAKTRDISQVLMGGLLLTPGLLMGIVTANSKWANSVIDVTQAASLASATAITLTLPGAVELVRRRGSTGTFKLTGPPTAAGTVATETVTYSGVNTGTGVVTCSAITAAFIAGSFVQPTDGSETPKSFIDEGYGLTMGTTTGNLPAYAPWPQIPIGGFVKDSQLIPAPTDASLAQWIRAALATAGQGLFQFSGKFV